MKYSVLLIVTILFSSESFSPDRGRNLKDSHEELQAEYARSVLGKNDQKNVKLKLDKSIVHPEAYRVTRKGKRIVVEAASAAGFIYGAQAVVRGELTAGQVERPGFDIRGTTLWIEGHVIERRIAPYHSQFNAEKFSWFFDRSFMTRYLDAMANARYNTIFVWASHPFPHIMELPEYPNATDLTPVQLKQNQEQFVWFTSECQRRNIKVLLHFYNIHLPHNLVGQFGGKQSGGFGAASINQPTPEVARYYRYILDRYFEEFSNVGLYICPGETLASSAQLDWFRDVLFASATKSGKNPLLVIRDWTMNMEFRSQISSLYKNTYSELKHNDESFTSPVPDRRHEQWRDVLQGHIVNLHGPAMDLQPMRWGSPVLISETIGEWLKLGFVKGAEIYSMSCFDWPITQDKLDPQQFGYREQVQGSTLLALDRDKIYYDAFGRYLWNNTRGRQAENDYWEKYLADKFGSEAAGKALLKWYVLTGPISPGMQNLTAVKFGNFWASTMLQNQFIDAIIKVRTRISDIPVTLTQEAGRTRQIYYSQPVDSYFFDRYKLQYNLPGLKERLSMPVAQYAAELSAGRIVTDAMTPDKVCDLLCKLAEEALKTAHDAEASVSDLGAKQELGRFVTDSEMYLLATRALRHKVHAALLKEQMILKGSRKDLADQFMAQMEQSVKVYEELAALTDRTYRNANDLMGRHWKNEGIAEFRKDLADQKEWLAMFMNGQ